MAFERQIDKNQKIAPDFKQIVKECFSSIFETLGKNNFRRWLHTRELSQDVQDLIYDWMTKEDKEHYPTWDGYAKTNSPEIRIRRAQTAKDTSIHELYHLLTRYSSSFGIYINEGMTEYLKGMTSENGPNSYMENVRMVKFLHEILGDSFVKAYLLGKDESFDQKFAKVIAENPDDLLKSKKEIDEFYKTLNRRHRILYPNTKDEIENVKKEDIQQEFKETTIEIKNMIKNIIIGKTRQMSKDLEFYNNGKITNLELVDKWIRAIPLDFEFTMEEKYDLTHEALGEIFENSHLLVDLEGEEKEQKKEELISLIISATKDEKGNINQAEYSYKNTEQINQEDKDITSKLFQKSFENNENISVMDFIDKTLKISTHIKPSQRELEALISQYAILKFGEKTNISVIDDLIKKNLNRYQYLFDIEQERKKNTIESQYRKIDDTSYIEKRDNQYFYIQIDKNGRMLESELRDNYYNFDIKTGKITKIERYKNNEKIVRIIQKQDENEKIIRKVYRIYDNKEVKTISIKDGLDSLQIYGKPDKYKEFGVMDSKEFREIEMISPILQQIRDKNYGIILNDAENPYKIKGITYTANIDERSRTIDWTKLSKDIEKIGQVLQENNKGKLLENILIEEVLDNTYRTVKKEKANSEFIREESNQEAYDEIKKGIIQNELENKSFKHAIDTLNSSRRKRIEENKKHALVGFKTPGAKEEYLKQEEIKKIRNQIRIKFELEQEISKPGALPIGRYFEEEGEISQTLRNKTKDIAFGLKGVSLVGPTINDRTRKLLVEKLCEDLSSKTIGLTSKKDKKILLHRYIEKVLDGVYETPWKSKKENEQIQECYDNISKSIIENIIDGTEIDEELMKSNTTIINENRQKRIRQENEQSGHLIWIKNKTSKMIYEQLVDLSKKLPQSQFDIVAQNLVNAANKEYFKGEKDGKIK